MRAPHVSSRCRPSVESIESAHESSPINNAVEAAISFDVMSMMLIAIEMVSFKCRDTCVVSRIRFTSDKLFANVRTIRVGIEVTFLCYRVINVKITGANVKITVANVTT